MRYCHFAPTDLRVSGAHDIGTERFREKLSPEAKADDRYFGRNGVAQQAQEWRVPWKVVVGAHRPTHHRDAGERPRIRRHHLAMIERDEFPWNALRVKPLAEVTRAFGRRKAK